LNKHVITKHWKSRKFTCPMGLDKLHCQNCFFAPNGKCEWERMVGIARQCPVAVYPLTCGKEDCSGCELKINALAKINEGLEN